MLLVPLGSCEQHGPHLPLGTDTTIALAIAERVGQGFPPDEMAVAPAVAYGASGEHQAFPGTLSIGTDALEHVLVELVRSADAFAGVVFVNGHGGNRAPVTSAVARMRTERRRVLAWWPDVAGGDAHAGRTETSLMLAIDPSAVRLELATEGTTAPLAELWPALRSGGVAAVSPSGVLGDPRGATADEGQRLLGALVAGCREAVRAWTLAEGAAGDGGP